MHPPIDSACYFGASLPATLVVGQTLIRQSAPLNMHLLGGIMDSAGSGSHFHRIDHSESPQKSRIVQQFPLEPNISHIFQFFRLIKHFFTPKIGSRYSSQRAGSNGSHRWPEKRFRQLFWGEENCRLVFIWPRSWPPLKWALSGGRSNFSRAG